MCGIAGIIAFNDAGRDWIRHLPGATDNMSRRGPDNGRCFTDELVGLGHRRLSIIDVSEQANQPMSDDSGNYQIIFNGEIFNYRELKKELEEQGVTFKTQSDTEVLLKLYIREKSAFLNKLNGFFSFAIYDKRNQSLFIVRDRYGIKPLLYYHDENCLVFASEMKGLLGFPVKKEMDEASLYQYFQLNYIPAPATIFKGVHKLLPGHFLMIKNKEMVQEQYYDIPYDEAQVNRDISYAEAQQKLEALLDDAVKRRLISDVPLGAFLSGGIDSSVVVALASRHTDKLNTFSIGYKDQPYFDETWYAELVANKFNTEHTVFSLTMNQLYEELHQVLDYMDEPFADSSALPVHILSRHTRKHVTVALSGDGADELFGGYMKHVGEYKMREGGALMGAIKLLAPLLKMVPKSRNNFMANKARQMQKLALNSGLDAKARFWNLCSISSEAEAAKLIHASAKATLEAAKRKEQYTRYITPGGNMNDVLNADMHLVLQGDMLTKVDLMSMANSLEVRVPFLDYRVVNFAFLLPYHYKIKGNERKRILQDAFRKILPDDLYHRPKKGFEVPLLGWFRTEMKNEIDAVLNDSFIKEQGIFDPEEIRKLRQKLASANPEDSTARIWALVVFQHWWKKYFN